MTSSASVECLIKKKKDRTKEALFFVVSQLILDISLSWELWTVRKQGFHWWSLLWGLCRLVHRHWTHLTGSVLCLRSGPNGSLPDRWLCTLWPTRPTPTPPQSIPARYASPRYVTPRPAMPCHTIAYPSVLSRVVCVCVVWCGRCAKWWKMMQLRNWQFCVREARMCSALKSDICV